MTYRRIFLIDADYLILKAALKAETVIDWGDGLHTLHSELSEAYRLFKLETGKLEEQLGFESRYDQMLYCFSDVAGRYWRHDVFPEYKANRLKHLVGKRRPIVFQPLMEAVRSTHFWAARTKLEADDLLGNMSDCGVSRILVSPDKDLQTIPGKLFDPLHPKRGIVTITQEEADYALMTQCLVGDKTDGYPGCKGVGVVRAAKILEPHRHSDSEMWQAVLDAYDNAGHSKDFALMNMRVAYILRPGDWSDEFGVRLWDESKLHY